VRCSVGVDLGSTTTKAVVLGEDGAVLGRGITNSRSDYDVACQVALAEAFIDTRFSLVAGELERAGLEAEARGRLLAELERGFRAEQYRSQLAVLRDVVERLLRRLLTRPAGLADAIEAILAAMEAEVDALYAAGARRKSDFFRDLAGSRYLALAEGEARSRGVSFDTLAGLYDKAILEVEGSSAAAGRFEDHARAAARGLSAVEPLLGPAVDRAAAVEL